MADLTHQQLMALLRYNPDTGEFSRAIPGKQKIGSVTTNGYIGIRVNYRRYLAHRLAWFYVNEEWPSSELDHINGDKTDNRIANLRLATRSLNNANTKCRSKSGLKGVVLIKYGYRAGITINKRFHYLGTYETPEEAHAAYCRAAKKAFGDFHRAA
jgi:hypothetical protein